MRNQTRIVAAAALALGSITFVARGDDSTAANNPNNANNANAPANVNVNGQPGAAVSDADAQAIRMRLAQATQDAFAADPISNLRQDLRQTDADRLANANIKSDDLNQLTDDIKKAWHDKYNDDLSAKDPQTAFSDVQIVQGDYNLGNQARTASEKLFPNQPANQNRGNIVSPNATANPDQNTAPTATAIYSSKSGSGNEVDVQLVQSSNGVNAAQWRIQTYSTLDAQTLHDSLLKQLTAVRDHEADWPSDENQAFYQVSRHVMEAVEGTNINGNTNNQNPSDMNAQPNNPNNPNNPEDNTGNQPSVQH